MSQKERKLSSRETRRKEFFDQQVMALESQGYVIYMDHPYECGVVVFEK